MENETQKKRTVRTYTQAEKEQAYALLCVLPMSQVAKQLNIPKTTVKRWYDGMKASRSSALSGTKGPKNNKAIKNSSDFCADNPNILSKSRSSSTANIYSFNDAAEQSEHDVYNARETECDRKCSMFDTQNARSNGESFKNLEQFAENSWKLAETALDQLLYRIDKFGKDVEKVYELMEFILNNKNLVLSGEDKNNYPDGVVKTLFKTLEKIAAIKINELATVFGVAYDKYALVSGKPTKNVTCSFEDFPENL